MSATGRNSRRTPTPREHTEATDTVTPVQFVQPEHVREPEHLSPTADHSEARMRDLRTPFDPS
ncbi:hypothetical protein GCM10027563_28450 [Parasphingorhabdus pacifica]